MQTGEGLDQIAGTVKLPLGPSLLAAVSTVLARYTDRSELVLGYTPDRDVTPRAVSVNLDGERTFQELLSAINAALDVDGRHDDLSSVDAVVSLGQSPPRESAHPPWLVAADDGQSVSLILHRNGSSALTAIPEELFVGHVRVLLAAASASPSASIRSLPVLTEPEEQQLLVEWNDTAAPFPQRCLHELVAEQARQSPDTVAAQFRDRQLTYSELDARSNQLARHLVALGVRRDVLVGICVERSSEMVVGLLGILKAGGAYVPIDPAYPADRQAYMLENSQAPVVVTEERLRPGLPVGDAAVVCLDHDWPVIAQLPADPVAVDADPEQLAYVIYTSGSTGLPKGVQIPHRALVNFLITMREVPGLSADDVLLAVTTLSFDIAGLELYLPLVTGARVVIAPGETTSDPRALIELLQASGATVMQATPTTWRMLLDAGWTGHEGLKALCGGEALPASLADGLVGLGIELWNMYGPTETTIWSTCSRVRTQGEQITIGRPIANTKLYVLDAAMNPVPVGVPGELWIGGDGLARGYRGRPDLTDERFIPDPFDDTPRARIYKTGDLTRYRADGNVEYIGRIDHQVKVRGFRIELGEIETVLSRHPAVASAVVVARGTGADAELAAYVIPTGVPVAALGLRQYLTQKLPAYMVPSTVTSLEAFPLTPNGKVDRKALPEPTRERSSDRELVAPRTALERQLTDIWERELDIHPIGITDNFFDLGVTSIVAASLFAAIEHDVGDQLPLGAIFRAPTIEALAALLESGTERSRWTSLVPIQTEGSQPPIFCMHGGGGTVLHLEPLARRLGTDQPFYGLQSKGLYGGIKPPQTVEDMASHYLSEMRQVHPGGPWRLAGYCFGTLVAFELAQRLVAVGEEVELLAMFNGPSPSWIRQWGWYGNQPSKRKARPAPTRVTRRQRAEELRFRLRRARREPRRVRTALQWHARRVGGQRRAQLTLALGRPMPEDLREQYFLRLHAKAERIYEPRPYDGDVIVFYGEGLYEDPSLGWSGLTTRELYTYGVPGDHENNRQAMMEPFVGFVSERLSEHLEAGARA